MHTLSTPTPVPVDWSQIDCVFLDMDGTLLDLHYDNQVWNQRVPQAYASQHGISAAQASDLLLQHMREVYGTLDFYSFDYWIRYTNIDLIGIHESATDLLAFRPGAQAFLRWLSAAPVAAVIATNAHPDSIRIKNRHTRICDLADAVVSSHGYAAAKEDASFWQRLLQAHPFDPARCLFIDDNEPILDAAGRCGIGQLLTIVQPDSQRPGRSGLRYPAFNDFAEICPDIVETTDPFPGGAQRA